MKRWIETKTGIIWGTFSGWSWDTRAHGPRPLLYAVVRPSGTSWCRIEIGVGPKSLYVHWGMIP